MPEPSPAAEARADVPALPRTEEPTGPLRLLDGGPFSRYILGDAVSMVGSWMQLTAQAFVLTTLSPKAISFGLLYGVNALPAIVLSAVGGSAADRYDKRRILLVTQVVQIILALVLGWLVATQRIAYWHLLTATLLLGVATAFEMPAASALVPDLVTRGQIARAVAVDRANFHATRLVGPALAGWVVGRYGPASAFWINAISFLALMAALWSLPPRRVGSAEEERQRASGFREGLTYVWTDPPTLAMITFIALTTALVFPFVAVMLPLYARQTLGLPGDQMGYLMACSGLGSLTGALALLAITRGRRRARLFGGTVLVSCSMLVLSRAEHFAVPAVSLVILSLGLSTIIGLANTIVQERAPAALRGRVAAIAGLSFFGLMPVAGVLTTTVTDRLGMRGALALAAVAYQVCTLVLLLGPGRRATTETTAVGLA